MIQQSPNLIRSAVVLGGLWIGKFERAEMKRAWADNDLRATSPSVHDLEEIISEPGPGNMRMGRKTWKSARVIEHRLRHSGNVNRAGATSMDLPPVISQKLEESEKHSIQQD